MDGGRGWNRTTNLSIKSRMLCQLSYASVRVNSLNVEQHPGGHGAQRQRMPYEKYSMETA